MLKKPKTPRQLQAEINQLKSEKEQLRLFLHEIIEAYYRTINQEKEEVEEEAKEEESHA